MKFVKEVDEKEIVVETDQEFLFSLYEREGFKRVKEKKEKTEEK